MCISGVGSFPMLSEGHILSVTAGGPLSLLCFLSVCPYVFSFVSISICLFGACTSI